MFETFALGDVELVVRGGVLVGMFLEGWFDLDAPIEIALHSNQSEGAGIDRKGDISAVGD